MSPIELFGWMLSLLLMVSFIASLIFISREPRLFSKSEYDSPQNNNQNREQKGKQFY
ncbi:hypothetical protein NLX67_16000 [Domibacillus sp. A3M-37]|uniref:hypothetical protein n=1 Tax=Domibacillus sp. A3M-37 TaxID=2962037 RepID=UPI0020B6CC38|nr:hypothetical protein [Domibacillus sp. A3M-37]MCP3763875.1 hypothetical protein [Domibacillus sp. A3M-37]